jgi:DNA-binding response OmpR family regulator
MTAHGRVVLIVEDEMIVAMDLQMQMEDAGWRVLGPVGTIRAAEDMLGEARPDCALLDVNFGEETSFGLARTLIRRGTRVVFLTGKTRSALPEGLNHLEMLQKPIRHDALTRLLGAPPEAASR